MRQWGIRGILGEPRDLGMPGGGWEYQGIWGPKGIWGVWQDLGHPRGWGCLERWQGERFGGASSGVNVSPFIPKLSFPPRAPG